MLQAQRKLFSSIRKLPHLRKYGDFKFNFKSFLIDLPLQLSNVQNRKADAKLELIEKYISNKQINQMISICSGKD